MSRTERYAQTRECTRYVFLTSAIHDFTALELSCAARNTAIVRFLFCWKEQKLTLSLIFVEPTQEVRTLAECTPRIAGLIGNVGSALLERVAQNIDHVVVLIQLQHPLTQ